MKLAPQDNVAVALRRLAAGETVRLESQARVSMRVDELTKSEALGHLEFVVTYKSFEPLGPACLPG
jgi:hypothetical protein